MIVMIEHWIYGYVFLTEIDCNY